MLHLVVLYVFGGMQLMCVNFLTPIIFNICEVERFLTIHQCLESKQWPNTCTSPTDLAPSCVVSFLRWRWSAFKLLWFEPGSRSKRTRSSRWISIIRGNSGKLRIEIARCCCCCQNIIRRLCLRLCLHAAPDVVNLRAIGNMCALYDNLTW
jgi:hypothetical protein